MLRTLFFDVLMTVLAVILMSASSLATAETGIRYKVFKSAMFPHSPAIKADCRTKPYQYDLLFYSAYNNRFEESRKMYYVYDGARYHGSTTSLNSEQLLTIANDLKVTMPENGRNFGRFFALDEATIRSSVEQCNFIHGEYLTANEEKKARQKEMAEAEALKRAQEIEITNANLALAKEARLQKEATERVAAQKRVAAEENRQALSLRKIKEVSIAYQTQAITKPYNILTFDELIALILENGVSEYKGKFFWVADKDAYTVSQVVDGIIMLNRHNSNNTIGIQYSGDVIAGQRYKSISQRPLQFNGVNAATTILGATKQVMMFTPL